VWTVLPGSAPIRPVRMPHTRTRSTRSGVAAAGVRLIRADEATRRSSGSGGSGSPNPVPPGSATSSTSSATSSASCAWGDNDRPGRRRGRRRPWAADPAHRRPCHQLLAPAGWFTAGSPTAFCIVWGACAASPGCPVQAAARNGAPATLTRIAPATAGADPGIALRQTTRAGPSAPERTTFAHTGEGYGAAWWRGRQGKGGRHETLTVGSVRPRAGDPDRRPRRARGAGPDAAVRRAGAGLPADDDVHDGRDARPGCDAREERKPRPIAGRS
jgi:hypothetical protein